MESKKEEPTRMKTIVPIKGHLLEKLKNKLKKNGATVPTTASKDLINNNNQNADNAPGTVKEETQSKPKVIIQKVEKVEYEISQLFGEKLDQSSPVQQTINEVDEANTPQESTAVENPKEESPESISLLKAKMPENNFNTEIPLKVVRTIRRPKPVPNVIRKRYGTVSIHQKSVETENVQEKEQPAASTSKECVENSEEMTQNTNETIIEPPKEEIVEKVKEESMEVDKNIDLPVTSYEIALPSFVETNECVEKNEVEALHINSLDEVIEKKEENKNDDSEEGGEEKDEEEIMDTSEATWLNDISVMIGENRIKQIDDSLKKIPSIVTGNQIQTENVELKLIINHLLSKLQAKSVTETLDSPSTSGLNLNDSLKYDFSSDTYDDLTEDDISKDSSFFRAKLSDKPIEEQTDSIEKSSEAEKPDDVASKPTSTEVSSETRKRRGRAVNPSKAKRAKIQEKLEETSHTENANEMPARDSSVESEGLIESIKRRRGRLPRPIKDSSESDSAMQTRASDKNSVILDSNLPASSRKMRWSTPKKVDSNDNKKKKVTRVQELKDSHESCKLSTDSDTEKGKRKIVQKASPSIEETSRNAQKTTSVKNNINKRKASKIVPSSDSESEALPLSTSSNELKSNSRLNDCNSLKTYRSSILERNDYLNKSSSVDKSKGSIADHPVCIELGEVLEKRKESDPLYKQPAQRQKRPYLITSAFKGNLSNNDIACNTSANEANVPCTNEPSVSHDSKINNNNKMKNGNIREIMRNLIDKQKQKIETPATLNLRSKPSPSPPPSKPVTPKSTNKQNRGKTKDVEKKTSSKKIFEQEKIEEADESKVMYNEILEAIRITDPSYAKGKRDPVYEENRQKIENELRSLKHFRCGSCTYLVTKHTWRQHIIDHGGVAWIENYEFPIKIEEWNESVRRLINIMKIYRLEFLQCSNCGDKKRSALGHLTHIYNCCEDEETIESRKMQCLHCDERVMPYMMSYHRNKCKGLQKIEDEKSSIEVKDESDEECSRDSSINSTGRSKRKAVKRAEKKVKSMISDLKKSEAGDGESEEAFEDADSDGETYQEDHEKESSETEGSSGDESSELESIDEDNDEVDFDESNVSNRKGKPSTSESQEVKNARKLIAAYAESLQGSKLSSKTTKWTKEFFNDHLSEILLPELAPQYKVVNIKLSVFLSNVRLNMQSMKFNTRITDEYKTKYLVQAEDNWRELKVGESFGSKQSLTLFCGGSVSSLDWARTSDGQNEFLAVACNSYQTPCTLNLTKTNHACIQVFKLQNLVSENSSENVLKELYMFSIADGPIWSIRFHPFVLSTDNRIGLLAVTTANECVYVFSLPHLKNDDEGNRNLVISLEPSIICKLSEEINFHRDNFLLQVSTVNWYYRRDQIQLLAAGFTNGLISIWMIDDEDENELRSSGDRRTVTLLPYLIFQAHCELITAMDFKSSIDSEIYLMTTSADRDVKVFAIENGQYREIVSEYASSRKTCAEWMLHWPGFVSANDDCFAPGSLSYRQPLEFGTRTLHLLHTNSAITDLSVNNWLNYIVLTSDTGDVFGSNPPQLFNSCVTDKWQAYGNTVLSQTDVIKIPDSSADEYGIIFSDLKTKLSRKPKSFRKSPSMFAEQLQINTIRFNHNEMSHRFFAIGYETGFVRIKHLKNFK